MMSAAFPHAEGATPLLPDDLRGLKLASVITQADLNAAEEANILAGMNWSRRTRRTDLLSRAFILELHKRMFRDVWLWAGTWRTRQTNIGVEANAVPSRVEALLRDVAFWLEAKTYDTDEIAVRLHHQLVYIHPFPNGNGRHTRLMADLLLQRQGQAPMSWGRGDLSSPSETRKTYIKPCNPPTPATSPHCSPSPAADLGWPRPDQYDGD